MSLLSRRRRSPRPRPPAELAMISPSPDTGPTWRIGRLFLLSARWQVEPPGDHPARQPVPAHSIHRSQSARIPNNTVEQGHQGQARVGRTSARGGGVRERVPSPRGHRALQRGGGARRGLLHTAGRVGRVAARIRACGSAPVNDPGSASKRDPMPRLNRQQKPVGYGDGEGHRCTPVRGQESAPVHRQGLDSRRPRERQPEGRSLPPGYL